MKYLFSLTILLGIYTNALAQLQDDFSDGDFTQNPAWSGDENHFTIDNLQLRSAGPSATATLALSTANTRINQTEWRFLLDLRFAPSASNQVRIYLTASQNDLKTALNGYYLEIGQTGSDFIRVFRQDGTANSLLFTGNTAFTANVKVRIKIIRDNLGNWQVSADPNGGEVFTAEGDAFLDNTYTSTQFFGIVCRHTSSNAANFLFDDFYIGDEIIDNSPPTLQSISVLSANSIRLQWNEPLINTIAQDSTNYQANNGLGNPDVVQTNPLDPTQAILTWSNLLISGQNNTLIISNLQDLAGNVLNPNPTQVTFTYNAPPQYHELVISEIMADPTGDAAPLNGLPEAEFVELHNRSSRMLNLKDVIFRDEGGSFQLPEFMLPPDDYVIICAQAQAADFALYGDVLPIPSFPSLSNGGETLMLENTLGGLIFAVKYDDSWYQNSSKATGGWTLEMIDTNNPCAERNNWLASEDPKGGTPGKINSINALKPDFTAPELWRAEALNTQTVRLTFNEPMSQSSIQNGTYLLSDGLTVSQVQPLAPFFKEAILTISPPINPQQSYQITVEGLTDCNQNLITNRNQANFGLASPSDSADVILNEILFNPRTAGSDFVELYNRSTKFINLKNWKLANLNNGIIANQRVITQEDYILAPQAYLLLSSDTDNIKDYYPLSKPSTFLEMSSLPNYNNDAGTVFISNEQGEIMERFDYQEDFHFPLLDDKKGISLERISTEAPTNQADSWKSASAGVGFATPGYLNSQQARSPANRGEITLNPQILTPDGDGQDDFTQIKYRFQQSSYLVDVFIYDRNGKEIKRIAERKLLGKEEGFFTWDGTDNEGRIARVGYYLVLVKTLDLQGATQVYKEKVVIGKRF